MREPAPIVSIHIPKTAGSRFRRLLERTYGERLALFYGPDDKRTHPLLRGVRGAVSRDTVRALTDFGIEIVHGHYPARRFAGAVPDASRYWVWLREPIEHTISHYYFLSTMEVRRGGPAELVQRKRMSLDDFLRTRLADNIQTRSTDAFPIESYGFVGVTELFAEMAPKLGLVPGPDRGNVNADKPQIDVATRRRILPVVSEDIALYSWALEAAMRDLGRRSTHAPGPLGRLAAALRPARVSRHPAKAGPE